MLNSDSDYPFVPDAPWEPFDWTYYDPPAVPAQTCAICNTDQDLIWVNEHRVCQGCAGAMQAYQDKVNRRYERLLAAADRSEKEGQGLRQRANQYAEIMNGQPILIGHHSEKRHRRMIERKHNWDRKAFEHYRTAEHLKRRAAAARSNRTISSEDPAAVVKLREKLAALEARQAHMVRVNKIVRKLCKMPKMEELPPLVRLDDPQRREAWKRNEQRYSEAAATWPTLAPELAKQADISEAEALRLLKPDFLHRIGYPDYETKNNGAEIRRLKARIEELSTQRVQAATQGNEAIEYSGGIALIINRDENRVQIQFPAKPASDTISLLKQNGFKWAPSQGAWQRQLNTSAEWHARHVLDRIGAKAE